MWNFRSAAHRVVTAFICLISTLIVGGAQAQTATDASDSKRVQVLQIREASATKESSVKKSKSAATSAKKKVAQRNTVRQAKATATETAMPAQNDTLTLPAEQTGTFAVGDRAFAFAASPGEDNNVGLSVPNYVGTREDQSASAIAIGNPPRAMVGRQVPSSGSSPLSQSLATLSGAMLAAAFGWYLVNSSRRRISLGVGT